MKNFECKRCQKESKPNYNDNQGTPCVVCEHCGAKHAVIKLPTSEGEALQLQIKGLLGE